MSIYFIENYIIQNIEFMFRILKCDNSIMYYCLLLYKENVKIFTRT